MTQGGRKAPLLMPGEVKLPSRNDVLFACFYLSLTKMASWDLMARFYRKVGEAVLNDALTSG